MGLLARITDERDRHAIDAEAARMKSERDAEERRAQIRAIVAGAVLRVASSLGEAVVELKDGEYFQLGDLIIRVLQFHPRKSLDPTSMTTKEIREEFKVLLVGRSGTTVTNTLIGCLCYLDFRGLSKAVGQAPFGVELEADAVIDALVERELISMSDSRAISE